MSERNKFKFSVYYKSWYQRNKIKHIQNVLTWQRQHKDKIKVYQSKYHKKIRGSRKKSRRNKHDTS